MANYMYLTDPTLANKITLFRSKSISDNTIKALIEAGILVESLETITKRIELIEVDGEKLSEDNINLLKKDLIKYYDRIELLKSLGIELDANEVRNYMELIVSTPYLEADLEILKQYLVRIVRKNGKYALDIFWKSPTELVTTIDKMIEASLEEVMVANPETLGLNVDELIKRVKYCNENGIPYYNREKEATESYITSPLDFQNQFPEANLNDININTNNEKISELTGNEYVNMLTGTLNSKYAKDIIEYDELTEEEKNNVKKLTDIIERNFNADTTSPNTYVISDVVVSKKKVERNLALLIKFMNQEGRTIEGLEKELVLTAILHNMISGEEAMNKIANSSMGFNESVGGMNI